MRQSKALDEAGTFSDTNRRALIVGFGGWLCLGLLSAFLLFIRYPFSYTNPNFYAEDGKVFAANILIDGPIGALGHLFNGYLVVGQYLVGDLGLLINTLFGHGFVSLPKAMAIASYLVFGFACALPWLLFRRRIGTIWACLLVLLLTFVPLGGIDFTILGTIGNLKFLFFYIAFIFIIYRNLIAKENLKYKTILVDSIIFLCVLTNITVVALLPLAIYPYRKDILAIMKTKKPRKHFSIGLTSLMVLCLLSLMYIIIIYKLGIPKTPGYLDEPLSVVGLVNTIYRSSWYGILFPLQPVISHLFVGLLLLITLGVFIFKKYRFFSFSILYAVLVCALGFALNRTGITQYFNGYALDGGPGQFFYAGTMIFIFGIAYLSAAWFKSLHVKPRCLVLAGLGLYLVLAIPLAGSRQKSFETYSYRPTIAPALADACAKSGDEVKIAIYPSADWYMKVHRHDVCAN